MCCFLHNKKEEEKKMGERDKGVDCQVFIEILLMNSLIDITDENISSVILSVIITHR